MHHHHGRLAQFFDAWHALFPPDADYRHDQMELRSELSDEQKEIEPRNADSHLTFIGSGMRNCVTYRNQPLAPVYFIDLDGTNGAACRERKTTIVAYDEEQVVARESFVVPVSHHPIDSVNLGDPRIGLVDRDQRAARRRRGSRRAASTSRCGRASATSGSRSTSTRRC